MSEHGRIPTLDGWRGIAISMVVVFHLQFTFFNRQVAWWPQTGETGVTLFFVLSGFLITSLLIQNQDTLRMFYTRRFFRLMPAAWTYLAFIVLFRLLTHAPIVSVRAIVASVFFYRNLLSIQNPEGLATGHFWSLSIEEQFYLLWPPILLTLPRRWTKWLCGAGILASMTWKLSGVPNGANANIFLDGDALLIGCFLALLTQKEAILLRFASLARWLALPALLTLVWLVAVTSFTFKRSTLEPLSIAILLMTTTCFSRAWWARWLEWKPLATVGRMAYSIYLWQEIFILFYGTWARPIGLLCIPLFSAASYYWIEQPSIRFGKVLAQRRPVVGYAMEMEVAKAEMHSL